jgi:uroporphyrinogen-III synthase
MPPRLPAAPARWAAFFSPSGVDAARLAPEAPWNTVRKAAIGPTTAERLRREGLPPRAVADRPTPDALAAAIETADRTHRT